KLQRQAGGEDLPEDVAQGLVRHVAVRPGHERPQGRMVRQGDRRGLVLADLAETPRRPRPLVEGHEQLRVELRDVLAKLVDLPLALGHEGNLTLARAPVTSRTLTPRARAPRSPGGVARQV